MKPFSVTTLADRVFEQLESDIIQGVYARGEMLTELRLVEKLGVSRTPIREAMRRLEQERLVEDAGKGLRVLGITTEDLTDIMDIRLRLEGLVTRYAAENRSSEDLERLREIVDLQEYYFTRHDAEHMRELDDRFHEEICRMSGRTVLCDTLLPLHRKTRRYRKASITNDSRAPFVIREHRAIYDAVKAQDGKKAAELAVQHVENARKNMLEGRKNDGKDLNGKTSERASS